MKLVVIISVIAMTFVTNAFSARDQVCSDSTKVCVSYESDKEFTTKEEGRFQLAIISSEESVEFVKADLWMQMGSHGHGSAPLKITQISPLQFDVTKAYFVMKGKWQIRVTYNVNGKPETLILTTTIKE